MVFPCSLQLSASDADGFDSCKYSIFQKAFTVFFGSSPVLGPFCHRLEELVKGYPSSGVSNLQPPRSHKHTENKAHFVIISILCF